LEKKALPYPCKLIKIIEKQSELLAQIQFSGQSHVLEVDPKKIIDENLFQYFSPLDIKQLFEITYHKSQLVLSDTFFCQETNSEMLTFTNVITKNKITVTAENASLDKNLIKNISSLDAHKIGCIWGMEFIKKYLRK